MNLMVFIKLNLTSLLMELLKKFQVTSFMKNQKSEKYSRSDRSQENVNLVLESFAKDPEMSLRLRSQQVGVIIERSTKWTVYSALMTYHVVITQKLKPL